MRKPRIIFDFMRGSDISLERRAINVCNSINGNPHFISPMPTIQQLIEDTQAYTAGLSAARTRDLVKIAEKNALRTQLRTSLSNTANYVTAAAMGNRAIMISAGFAVSPENTAVVLAESIKNFTAMQGKNSGELLLSLSKPDGALSYSFYYAIAGGDQLVWAHVVSRKIKVTLKDLQPGKTYNCYVVAYGSNEWQLTSDTITKIVY